VKVLKAIRPLEANNLVRGSSAATARRRSGSRFKDGDFLPRCDWRVDFLALERGAILHPRWKELACDLYGSYRRFRKPPTVIKESALSRNHLRFRISPEMTIALAQL